MAAPATQKRVQRLEQHLKQENPVLAAAVASFQKLDRVQRHLGLADKNESLATQVSWWPVVSIVGTFSAGKSTFINQFVGEELQRTGNQAVDDKFTVICYGGSDSATALPGLALDSDPRFPFYQIGRQIEKVAEGEGRRVDSYLQLKTVKAEELRGKILIDSPGFDADQQRTSTLLIIDHIMDLSDLVLVFFDARHPEPGAMADTLSHLVSNTVNRADANKFLFISTRLTPRRARTTPRRWSPRGSVPWRSISSRQAASTASIRATCRYPSTTRRSANEWSASATRISPTSRPASARWKSSAPIA
jgi:hypothetical protein